MKFLNSLLHELQERELQNTLSSISSCIDLSRVILKDVENDAEALDRLNAALLFAKAINGTNGSGVNPCMMELPDFCFKISKGKIVLDV
ncbi:hypothetical protein [Shewanella holmiensis]|uniref:Uncharacterized protein n=1 Tax=Shewanella holmiensis TaxID=2952222 RepID=A0A9X2WQD5_9GAMM|nr:hypothetical protein [Shewanella holmiensis]MCT7943500.1 hypothetical protein [Shewanella holmiensis]